MSRPSAVDLARRAAQPDNAWGVRDLARRLGISHAACSQFIRAGKWPFAAKPPWNVPAVRRWREEELRRPSHTQQRAGAQPTDLPSLSGYTPSDLVLAQIRDTNAAAKIKELKGRQLEGSLHDVADCEARRLQQIHAVKAQLLSLPAHLATMLSGLAAPAIEQNIRTAVHRILTEFSGEQAVATLLPIKPVQHRKPKRKPKSRRNPKSSPRKPKSRRPSHAALLGRTPPGPPPSHPPPEGPLS